MSLRASRLGALLAALLLFAPPVARAQPTSQPAAPTADVPHGETSAPAPNARLAPRPRLRRPRSRPFGQGVFDLGGAAAFGASSTGGFQMTLGVNAGYFVLPGFEPGVQADVTFGSEIDSQITLLPFLRWMLFRSWGFTPYLKGVAGGLFVMASDRTVKMGLVGGGGGLVIGLGGRLALNLEFLALKVVPQDQCPLGECTLYRMGLSLSVLFGQAARVRHRRAPPPPPTDPTIAPDPAAPPAPGSPPSVPGTPTPSPDEVPTPVPDEPGLG